MAREVVPADVDDITLDEILAIKHPDPARWSPDGEWLAWRWDDGGLVQLWACRSDGSQMGQVSTGERSVGAFDWAPDGRLTYAQDGDIWIARPGTDECRPVTHGNDTDSSPRWSPIGNRLAFVRNGGLLVYDFDEQCLTSLPLPGRVAAGYADTISVRWSPDGAHIAAGIVVGQQRDLAIVSRTGELIWRTDTADNESAFAWVNEHRLHFSQIDPTTQVRSHSVVDIRTGETRELVREESERGLKGELPPVVRPGGTGVAYILTPENWPHVYYYDFTNESLRQLTDGSCDDTGHAGDGLQFSPSGDRLVFSSNRETDLNQRRLWMVEIDTGILTCLTSSPGTDSCASWSPNDRYVSFIHCSPDQSADIWLLDPTEPQQSRQITHSMPMTLTSEKTILPRHLTFPSNDGLQVHGDLFLPKGFDPTQRYPAVVWVHGGMSRQMRHGWHPMHSYSLFYSFNQYLLHRGFVLLSVDYRGSIGYGREYEEGTYLSMCQGDLADVVAGSTFLRTLPYVDQDSIGVYGLSYGGYMTLGALTKHPDAFAMGINIAGIWDWPQYERWRDETYPGSRWQGTQRLGGSPNSANDDAWYQASPKHFVSGLRKPLLNLMGTEDERVDFGQLHAIIRDCVANEKDFAVHYYPGETHTFTFRRTWRDAFPRMERAFQRYLMTPPDQRPPAMI